LRGDLDAIVMKAMQKQPAQRYESVAALAADVARYLDGEPVQARRRSASYRAAKFIRRNAVLVSAAAIVALSVVGGAVATSIGLVREARAHRIAQDEAAEAAAINRFLNEMLSSVDPGRDGRDIRVAEILERAADGVGARFEDRPEVEAALRTTIGQSYRALGMLAPAEPQLEKALALRETRYGAEHRETLESLNELGVLRIMQGDLPAAERLLERALESGRRQFGEGDELVLSILHSLAWLRNTQGRFPEAEMILRRLLPRLRAEHWEKRTRRRFAQSTIFRRTYTVRRRTKRPSSTRIARSSYTLKCTAPTTFTPSGPRATLVWSRWGGENSQKRSRCLSTHSRVNSAWWGTNTRIQSTRFTTWRCCVIVRAATQRRSSWPGTRWRPPRRHYRAAISRSGVTANSWARA
jgi:tetratricopeptide (TPR) repeat protein